MNTTQLPENPEPGPLLGLGSSAGLGLGDRLREKSRLGHWPLLGYEAADEIDRLNSERLDLALLVYRLMRRVEAARSGKGSKAGDDQMLAKAKDYLRRKGLQANPLRQDAGPNRF
jgi:hypothetical protein